MPSAADSADARKPQHRLEPSGAVDRALLVALFGLGLGALCILAVSVVHFM